MFWKFILYQTRFGYKKKFDKLEFVRSVTLRNYSHFEHFFALYNTNVKSYKQTNDKYYFIDFIKKKN